MFEDKRGKKVVLVAHCILNQNAKIDRCAHYPGAMMEVVHTLVEAGVGILQMPCPELMILGLERQVDRTARTTIESEDTRVGRSMATEAGQERCRQMAGDLVLQIEDYLNNGFEIVGVIGINGSPTCGVELSWADDQDQAEPGVFVRLLREALASRGVDLPFRGIKAYQPEHAVAAVQALLDPPRQD